MADVSDASVATAIADLKSDASETNWIMLGYEGKKKIILKKSGTGGHAEFLDNLELSEVFYCLLRVTSGDQESRRTKFVMVSWVGRDVGGMKKGMVAGHKADVAVVMGQHHVAVHAEEKADLSEDKIQKKLKAAGGADYDSGANKGGYTSAGGSIKAKAMERYAQTEAQGTIGPVVYETKALPKTTPVDLAGRKFVAPAAEGNKNIKDTVLDREKFKGQADMGTSVAAPPPKARTPTAAAPPSSSPAPVEPEAEPEPAPAPEEEEAAPPPAPEPEAEAEPAPEPEVDAEPVPAPEAEDEPPAPEPETVTGGADEEQAAIKIQAVFRGHTARKEAKA